MNLKHNHNTAIILAAGKGTRMKSALPKVLHPVASEPMLGHVMRAAMEAGCGRLAVVTSPEMPQVAAFAKKTDPNALIALQDQQLGTGHAVLAAKDVLADAGEVALVLFGDSPLISPETLIAMQNAVISDDSIALVVLGFEVNNPPAYGRLMMDDASELLEIIEAKDATPEQLAIRWCNGGVMAIRGRLLWEMLSQVKKDNAQGEYYLTDLVAIARNMGYRCGVFAGSETEALGVNSRAQLAQVEALMQTRLRDAAMECGVTMLNPESVTLAADTVFGQDVTIQPNVFFGKDVRVEDGALIKAFSHIEGATIGKNAEIGPFARLRPDAQIGEGCKIGNFVEIKKATLAAGAKVSHLSYIGDASIGENANIGAGTITCNYDGYNKYRTQIGKDVFVGSNSALVAPITIGEGAIIAAGSVITENVEAGALALARSRQTHKAQGAQAFKAKVNK